MPQALWIALAVLGTLQVLTLLVVFQLAGRVRRLSQGQGQSESQPAAVTTVRGAEREESADADSTDPQGTRGADQKHWFAEFLAEDPARQELTKKEQFEAFRRWRNERGLNWKG